VSADELSNWHLLYDLCPRLPLPERRCDFGIAAFSSRHSISADSLVVVVVVVVVVIVVAIGNEEVGGVVPKELLVPLLGRPTVDVSVAASVPTVEVIMMGSRTGLVDSAATALKINQSPLRLLGAGVVAMTNDDDDPGVIVSALVVASGVTAASIRLEAIVTVLVGSAANLLKVDQSPF
jgi:hypothetical protein